MEDNIIMICPFCNEHIELNGEQEGDMVECPSCNMMVDVEKF